MSKKLKKGIKVKVITGKYKNQEGEILKVLSKKNGLIIKNINLKKKTIKKTENEPGKIVDIESFVHISNVKTV